MELLGTIAKVAGYIVAIGGLYALIEKRLKPISAIADGQRSLLRGQILNIYYKHCDEAEPCLHEYERKTLDDAYNAYEALKGNSFVKDIYSTMREWKIVK